MKKVINHLFLFVFIVGFNSTLVARTSTSNSPTHFSSTLVSRPVGGAFLVFAGKNGGEVKKAELANQYELNVEGCAKGARIFSFTLEVTKGGKKTSLTANTNTLTQEMISRLKGLSPGDTFEFTAMKAYMPNGKDVVDVHGQKFVVV